VVTSLHGQHYVHCDIKPSNFMVQAGAVFLIDFGLAWQFRNPTTYLHIPCTTNHSVVGTPPFLSINGQQGHAQSHHDDLESLAYTIIFLACGKLPWSALSRDHSTVLWKKSLITAEDLCEGLPPVFSKFIIYVRSLGFKEKPDYEHLRTILLQCSETKADQLSNMLPSAFPSPNAKCTPSPSVASKCV